MTIDRRLMWLNLASVCVGWDGRLKIAQRIVITEIGTEREWEKRNGSSHGNLRDLLA